MDHDDLSMATGVQMTPVGSHDERHSAQSQEKNQHDMSLHGPHSYFSMEQFGVYLFCLSVTSPPQRVEFPVNQGGFLWATF